MSSEFFGSKFSIQHLLLKDFYIDLSLASILDLIMDTWDQNPTTNRDALHKDLVESENNRLRWSQNADGGRNKNELLTGNGSNIGGNTK